LFEFFPDGNVTDKKNVSSAIYVFSYLLFMFSIMSRMLKKCNNKCAHPVENKIKNGELTRSIHRFLSKLYVLAKKKWSLE